MSKKNNKKTSNSNGLTYVLLGVTGLLLILIAYLGIRIIITSNELKKIDEGVEELNKREIQKDKQEANELKSSNSLNTRQIEYSNKNDKNLNSLGMDAKINDDKTSATLTIDWEKYGKEISKDVTVTIPNKSMNYEIKGLTKKVKDVLIGKTNASASTAVIIFLMDDNTIQYTKIIKEENGKKIINSKTEENKQLFSIEGTIPKVTDVKDIYNVDATNKDTSYKTIIGTKQDGKFYDLGYAIENNK